MSGRNDDRAPGLLALIDAERRKITSTRLWWGLLIGAVLFVGLSVASGLFNAIVTSSTGPTAPPITSPAGVRNVFGAAMSTYLFALILGILGMNQEFRFQTITSTFLATPRRTRVMIAKLVAYAFVGAVFALVGAAVGFGIVLAVLRFHEHAPIEASTVLAILGGGVLGAALYAILGVAVGSLVRNQIAAVLGAIVWVVLIEALVVVFLPAVGKWLPGGALGGVLQQTGINGTTYLPVWGATLVLLGYTAAIGGLAAATTIRNDVT